MHISYIIENGKTAEKLCLPKHFFIALFFCFLVLKTHCQTLPLCTENQPTRDKHYPKMHHLVALLIHMYSIVMSALHSYIFRQLLKIALQVICGMLTSSMLLTLERVNASIALYSLNRNVLEKISTFF